jgi:hypothetical protein
MKKTKYILPIFAIAICMNAYTLPGKECSQQEPNWNSSNNWRLYKTNNLDGSSLSLDSLKHISNLPLNEDSIHFFLVKSKSIQVNNVAWMGYYTTTCDFPGNRHEKILISAYGGFFYDQSTGKYYELPIEIRKDWLEYFNNSYIAFDQ